jgi:hypothetical protein
MLVLLLLHAAALGCPGFGAAQSAVRYDALAFVAATTATAN